MAVVTDDFDCITTYSPFEGMTEAGRLLSGIPRGLVRFIRFGAISAKPVNDTYVLNITDSLPSGFAYVMAALNCHIEVDTASDWETQGRFRIFNGISGAPASMEQISIYHLQLNEPGSTLPNQLTLDYSLGEFRNFHATPIQGNISRNIPAFTLQMANKAAAVGAAGSIRFYTAFYQYDLTQAIRFPLNSPLPVTVR